ncbi:MAG: hypothetical protein RID91_12345 [Azospirillaceae bacterium]
MLLKLLLTIGVVIAVLYGARLFTSTTREGKDGGSGGRVKGGDAAKGGKVDRARDGAEDLKACPVCGAYTTGDAKGACEREDCPYRAS